jgi:hypothetical protein
MKTGVTGVMKSRRIRWCSNCEQPFAARTDAKTCSNACRQRAYRIRNAHHRPRSVRGTSPGASTTTHFRKPVGGPKHENRRTELASPHAFSGVVTDTTDTPSPGRKTRTKARFADHISEGRSLKAWVSRPNAAVWPIRGSAGVAPGPKPYGRDKSERHAVRLIVALHRRGESFAVVSGWLQAEGLRPRRSARWADSTLRAILRRWRWSPELPPL